MQLQPSPKDYPQDMACTLLQLLSFLVEGLSLAQAKVASTKSVIKMREQELREDGPTCRPISVRQQIRKGQAQLDTFKKAMEGTCKTIGRCPAYGSRSVAERVHDRRSTGAPAVYNL